MDSSNGKRKHRGYLTWTDKMDQALLDVLVEHHNNGNHTANGWKPHAYSALWKMCVRSAMWRSQGITCCRDARPLTSIAVPSASCSPVLSLDGIETRKWSWFTMRMLGKRTFRWGIQIRPYCFLLGYDDSSLYMVHIWWLFYRKTKQLRATKTKLSRIGMR